MQVKAELGADTFDDMENSAQTTITDGLRANRGEAVAQPLPPAPPVMMAPPPAPPGGVSSPSVPVSRGITEFGGVPLSVPRTTRAASGAVAPPPRMPAIQRVKNEYTESSPRSAARNSPRCKPRQNHFLTPRLQRELGVNASLQVRVVQSTFLFFLPTVCHKKIAGVCTERPQLFARLK